MNAQRALTFGAAVLVLACAGGCATVGPALPGAAVAQAKNPIDPWERWNRRVFAFNDAVDNAIVKPVAETYRTVVPQLVRTGIDNVLGNLYDVWSTVNHFLQGKGQVGLEMGMRVLTNTLFGLGGLLDPASEMKLERRSEDFGQTLGRWGIGNGPYVVLPLLGPSTVRDSAGLVLDRAVAPGSLPESAGARNGVTAVELLHARSKLLDTTRLADEVALDRYSFFRDAYLARRRDVLYDGAPPMETFDDAADPSTDTPPAKAAAPAASAASESK